MILGSELNDSNLYPMQINKKKQPWHYAPIFFHLRYADLILMQASWCFLQASIPVFIQSISSSTIQQGRMKNNQIRTSTVCRVLAKEMDTGAVQAQSKYILAPVCRWMESTSRNLSLTHGLRRSAIAAARRSLLAPKMWVTAPKQRLFVPENLQFPTSRYTYASSLMLGRPSKPNGAPSVRQEMEHLTVG